MQKSHKETILRYNDFRNEARKIAAENLPRHLKALSLAPVNKKAVIASHSWGNHPDRKVDWDWSFASRYSERYPKSFDLAVWAKSSLMSLTLGRPTYKGTSIRMDFVERMPGSCPYAGDLFAVSLLAYETYGSLIGADYIRLVEPMNQKLINYYMSEDVGFAFVGAKQGNPHYLVKKL